MIYNFIYLLSIVCWIGSIIFFSFIVAPIIFKTLDRKKAGEVVGEIFPLYYKLGYICGALILFSFLVSKAGAGQLKWYAWSNMIFASGFAGLVINPKAKKVKEKIKKDVLEKEKPILEARFKSLHSLSVKLNALVLLAGLWLLVSTTSTK